MQKTKNSKKVDGTASDPNSKNNNPIKKESTINGGVSSVSGVAPPVDEMKFFLDNLPIICNSNQIQSYIPVDRKQNAVEHSKRTLRDLLAQIEGLKFLVHLNEDLYLKKPTIMLALMRNGQKICVKLVYKLPDKLKILNKNIIAYTECKEKPNTSLEEKSKYQQKINGEEADKKFMEDFLKNEKNIINFKHKNCLKITWLGDFINHYVYLSEYCNNRDMLKFSKNIKRFLPINKGLVVPYFNFMSENLLRYFTTQILSAIEFFKNFKIIHGNLTLENILINNNFQIKITDFACSRFIRSNEIFSLKKNQLENSPEYLAPEFFRSDKFVEFRDAHKIDIFSLGCCLFMMATLKSLFEENKNNAQENSCIEHIVKQVRKIPDLLEMYTGKKWNPDFVKILQRMMEPFEKGRINIDELINSNWVRNNQRNLGKIEAVYQTVPNKMITEMMKADHVGYYNTSSREKEDEFLKITNSSINSKVIYNHIQIKKNISMQKNPNIKNLKYCNKNNVMNSKIRKT